MAFTIKQGDTRPAYVVDLKDNYQLAGEAPIDLTDATSVTLKMRTQGQVGVPKVDAAMEVTDAINGRVTYAWLAADTDTVGTYDVEFEIVWNDGGVETVPNTGFLTVSILDDLDA